MGDRDEHCAVVGTGAGVSTDGELWTHIETVRMRGVLMELRSANGGSENVMQVIDYGL